MVSFVSPRRFVRMEWLLGLFARAVVLVIWFTTPLVNRAFQGGWMVPRLGRALIGVDVADVCCRLGACWCSVTGLDWLWVAGALLLDLGVNSAPARLGVKTSRHRSAIPQNVQ